MIQRLSLIKQFASKTIWTLLTTLSLIAIAASNADASIVSLSTNVATGTADRQSSTDFIGVLDGVSPQTISGNSVDFNNIPTGESFEVGDIVGRDINATSGSRTWTYSMTLPSDAVSGTGFENIFFEGEAFENSGNNLENRDRLSWTMLVNGVAVDSSNSGFGVDFTSLNFTLSNAGGPLATNIQVVMTVNSFNGGSEWFVARGELSATYTAIPECGSVMGVFACLLLVGRRRVRVVSRIG